MKRALIAFLCLVGSACADQPTISVPGGISAKAGRIARIVVTAKDAVNVRYWCDSDQVDLFRELNPDAISLCFVTDTPGVYVVRVIASGSKGELTDPVFCLVTVGTPTPPIPPVPPVPPVPPAPVPIPGDGLRVLVVYKSADLPKLPRDQELVLYNQGLRLYLNGKSPVGPDGKTHEWRIYDAEVDASAESKVWQDALKRPRQTLPWIIISNGKTGFEGPLPANVDATMELLKKYGG